MLLGFFAGYISNTSALMAAMVPAKDSGKVMSTLVTGTTAGMLIGPLFGGVIAGLIGYRLTCLLTGIANLVVFLLTLLFVEEPNFDPITREKTLSLRMLFKHLEYPRLISGMFLTTLIIQAGNNLIAPIISLYVQQLLHGHGQITLTLVSGIVAALPGIATLIAAPLFGILGDRIGTQKILIGGLGFALLVFIPQIFVHNIWQFAFLRFLVGISDAALLPQVQTLLAKYAPAQYSGRIFSYNQSAMFMGSIVGPLIGSSISGAFGYSSVFLLTSVLILVNLLWARHSTSVINHAKNRVEDEMTEVDGEFSN